MDRNPIERIPGVQLAWGGGLLTAEATSWGGARNKKYPWFEKYLYITISKLLSVLLSVLRSLIILINLNMCTMSSRSVGYCTH